MDERVSDKLDWSLNSRAKNEFRKNCQDLRESILIDFKI